MTETIPGPTSVSEAARQYLSAPPMRLPYPPLDDVDAWEQLVAGTNAMFLQRGGDLQLPATVEDRLVDGVPTFVARPDGVADGGPVYLDFHGGALIIGGGDVCRLATTATAIGTRRTTWGVDYRMPPRHPFPAAVDDAVAVYRALVSEQDPSSIVVGGLSAGGNIATALLVRAREEGLPMPAGLVLLTPEVDLSESGDSFVTNAAADNILGSSLPANRLYAGGRELTDPLVSPLFADLAGLPPTFLQTGTRDLFLSNTVRMHRALRAAGVEAELHVFEAMPHGGFGGRTPEDADLATERRRFLDRVLTRPAR